MMLATNVGVRLRNGLRTFLIPSSLDVSENETKLRFCPRHIQQQGLVKQNPILPHKFNWSLMNRPQAVWIQFLPLFIRSHSFKNFMVAFFKKNNFHFQNNPTFLFGLLFQLINPIIYLCVQRYLTRLFEPFLQNQIILLIFTFFLMNFLFLASYWLRKSKH